MKRYWKLTLAALGALLLVGIIYAQTPSRQALPEHDQQTEKLLKLAHELYRELTMPGDAMHCRLDYTMETVMRTPNDSLVKRTAQILYYGSRNQMRMESADVSLYQDSAVGIVLLPATHELQLMPSTIDEVVRTKRDGLMRGFYNVLFERSQGVESLSLGKRGEYELVITPIPAIQHRQGIERITIRLSTEERKIHSVRTDYAKGGRYESVMVTYNDISCSDSDIPQNSEPETTLRETVLTPEGEIRPEFRDYTILDLRNSGNSE